MTLQEYANLLVANDIVVKDTEDDIYYFTDKGFMLLETFYPRYRTEWDNAINLTGWGGHPPVFWGIKEDGYCFDWHTEAEQNVLLYMINEVFKLDDGYVDLDDIIL